MAAHGMTRDRMREAIGAALMAWDGAPVVWGVSDCALAIADIYLVSFGVDLAEEFRGRYRTRIGARRVLGRGGLPRALREASRKMRWRRINPEDGQDGDLGMIQMPPGASPVIRRGAFWIGRAERGFAALPSSAVLRAWSVVPETYLVRHHPVGG